MKGLNNDASKRFLPTDVSNRTSERARGAQSSSLLTPNYDAIVIAKAMNNRGRCLSVAQDLSVPRYLR
jgi:hypothetical protein